MPRDDFWITDGEVNALLVTNGLVYIGGNFQNVGPQRAFGVEVNADNGVADFGYPKIDGPVTAVTPDGSGGWLIARTVFGTDGIGRSRLMRVRADKSVDPAWDISSGAFVYALLATVDRVYVGGGFGSIAGSPRRNLAALDLATAQPLQWDPSVGGEGEEVRALALSGQTLYVGGAFTSVGGVVRNSLAAVDVETGAVTGWNPRPEPNVPPAPVRALAISGTNVFVGGAFTSIGGSFRTNLAAVSTVNGFATSWNPIPDREIDSIALVGNTVFVTGTFTTIGGTARTSLAAIDATLGTATAWDPNPTPPLQTLIGPYISHFAPLFVDGDKLFVGGSFTNIAGQTRSGGASFDVATGGITAWNPYAMGGRPLNQFVTASQVTSLAIQGDRAYIGGLFRSVNGVPRRGLAALDVASGVVNSLSPGVSGVVVALALSGGTLYLGGSFSQVGSQPRTNLAAVDITNGQVASWSPEIGGTVNALATAANSVYIGGEFASIAGQSRTNLAAVGFDGPVRPWNPGANFGVVRLLAIGNVLYASGAFDQLAGHSRPGLGGVDLESGLVTSFNPTINPVLSGDSLRGVIIQGLALQGGRLFATGLAVARFRDYPYTASFDLLNSALSWEMLAGQWNGQRLARIGITAFQNTICVGDWYNFVLEMNPGSGVPIPWLSSGWGGQLVHEIVPAGDSLIVGGSFGTVNGVPVSNLAVFPPARAGKLGAQMMNNGSLRIQINNESAVQFVLQSTTNFSSWIPIVTNSGSFYYDDTNGTKTPAIFYRGITKP